MKMFIRTPSFLILANLLFGFVLSGLIAGLGYQQRSICTLAGVVLALTHLLALMFVDAWVMTVAAVIAGSVCLLAGHFFARHFSCESTAGQAILRVSGSLLILAAIVPELMLLIDRVDFGHWLSLTLIGVTVMTLATVWEKRRAAAANSAAEATADSASAQSLQHHHRNASA